MRSRFIYDISDDGQFILLQMETLDANHNISVRLAVVSVMDITKSQALNLEGKSIKAAAFVLGSSSQAWMVSDKGLIGYDLSSQTYKVLFPSLSSSWVDRAIFSPDRGWLALSRFAGDVEIYVLKLDRMLGQSSPNIQAIGSSKLSIISLCSPKPTEYRLWKIKNPNSSDIEFEWEILASDLSGKLQVKAQSEVELQTSKAPNNIDTLRIFVNGVYQDQVQSLDETPSLCASATATPANK